jgi:hypothetical protein
MAAPAAALAPPPAALHLVVRSADSSSICGNVVVHANAAIAAALRDDQTVEHSLDRLRSIDFDEPTFIQHTGVAELRRLSGDIAETSAKGAGEIQRLRGYAARIDEDRRRTELTVFADALEGALDRQGRIGQDLDRFLTDVAHREWRDGGLGTPLPNPDDTPPPGVHISSRIGGGSDRWDSANAEARATASEIDEHLGDVRRDESHAADLSDAAVGGC